MTRWEAPDGKSEVIDISQREGKVEPDKQYDSDDSPIIDAAVAFVIVAVTGTLCALVLHWAGVL